jgi:hypothetical protein
MKLKSLKQNSVVVTQHMISTKAKDGVGRVHELNKIFESFPTAHYTGN